MPSIDLYWSPGSCARVPFIALEHVGSPFELHVLNRYVGDHQTAEYRAINPKEKVPSIVIDGWAVTENPVIQTVLARTFPDAGLLPTGDERVVTDAMSTMAWFASGIQPAVGRQRFPGTFSDGDPASLERIRLVARKELAKAFAILEGRLADRDWLFEAWSIVDAYMLWLWFRAVGSGMDPTPFPRCADHARRTEDRPAVSRVLDREEAEFASFQDAGTVPAAIPPFQVGRTPTAVRAGA
ncbi:MAG: glutathione S-transferase family protein [Solirubrobacteraceae bacterium]